MSPDDPRHGTNAGHHAGCRLACCREARNRYERNSRKRRELGYRGIIDATGTRRRIQALMAMGWPQREIAERCDLASQGAVDKLVRTSLTVRLSTAGCVARVYDELSMTFGPSVITRKRAERNGWPPPLAWDNIDDPDEQPTDWRYKSADRGEALTELLERGVGVSEACRVLHCSREALEKWCERHGRRPDYQRLIHREHVEWRGQREGAA